MVKDKFGIEVKKGDIIARAIGSCIAFHNVLDITEKSIVLDRIFKSYNNLKSGYYDNAWSFEDLKKCDPKKGKIYYPKFNSQWSIIKLESNGKL